MAIIKDRSSKGFRPGSFVDGGWVPKIEVLPDINPIYLQLATEPVIIEGVFSVIADPTETSALALTVNYNDNSSIIVMPENYAHQAILDGMKKPTEKPKFPSVDLTI